VYLGLVVFNIALAMGMAFFNAGMLTQPIGVMVESLQKLGKGDMNRASYQAARSGIMARKDEIGDMARGLAAAKDYVMQMIGLAEQIAEGNLGVDIQLRSENDELGAAFSKMAGQLRLSIKEVAEKAALLNEASRQLAQTSSQAGQRPRRSLSPSSKLPAARSTFRIAGRAAGFVEQMGTCELKLWPKALRTRRTAWACFGNDG
jgi:methyl-accepting chemotaxis protein